MKLSERFQSAWNAFRNDRRPEDIAPEDINYYGYSVASSSYPQHKSRRPKGGNDRSIINSVLNKIAVDAAAIEIHHVQNDENGRFQSYKDSDLEECLDVSANLDQTGRAFRQDVIASLLDEGVVCVVPIDTTRDPLATDSYDIQSLRVGKVVDWYPAAVRVDCYDERTGRHQTIVMPKSDVAIIENPFAPVMNDATSLLRRIVRKLNMLDVIDNRVGSDKLDLIIQLPYGVRTQAQKARAEERQKDIEVQLSGSRYGIAYIDATEKVTQLGHSIENNLLPQVEFLTQLLFAQLGITQSILDGTADEATMLNYYNRMIAPILNAICDEYKRKFLTKTARTKGQSIEFFRNPFELVPVGSIADIADKFTRNEILSSNEVRGIIGFKPVNDERADELRNKNLNQSEAAESGQIAPVTTRQQGGDQSVQHSQVVNVQNMAEPRLLGTGQFVKRR